MATVVLPGVLRRLTGGQKNVSVEASTVKELVERLEAEYPGFKERLLNDNGDIKTFINVFVNGEEIRGLQGEDTPLGDSAEVSIIPAMAGGCSEER